MARLRWRRFRCCPPDPAPLAGIVISNRNLSLAFKVWQRTVAHGGRG